MQIFQVIDDVLRNPPIKFNPAGQTLKNWAMYCLRDSGFIVVYAQNADFAIEPKNKEKIYCKVTKNAENLDEKFGWIVLDSATNTASFIPPKS